MCRQVTGPWCARPSLIRMKTTVARLLRFKKGYVTGGGGTGQGKDSNARATPSLYLPSPGQT